MNKKHDHGTTSNTETCYSTFIGCTVRGFFEAHDGTKWLIFKCGWALVLNFNGSHWTENPETVSRALGRVSKSLEVMRHNLKNVLQLAGR